MRFLCIMLLSVMLLFGCEPREATIDGGPLGRVLVFEPTYQPTGFVFLLSDGRGWSSEMARAAEQLRERGLIVAGIDSASALANLARDQNRCLEVTGAFETVSQSIQKSAKLDFYSLPILAGIEEGAVLALAGLWQAGPETVAGAATVDFDPVLQGVVPLCADPPAVRTPDNKLFVYSPPKQMYGWWEAAWTRAASDAGRGFAEAASAIAPPIEAGSMPTRVLVRMLERNGETRAKSVGDVLKLGDLPVIEIPGKPGAGDVAIIFSGDGGWRDLDRTLGEILSNAGVKVLGIDCLRYFWSEKSPDTVAADLDNLIGQISRRTAKARIALIGYSFGADILPAVFNRLRAPARQHIDLLSLLAPGRDAHFVIHLAGWLGGDPQRDAVPIAPEIARIQSQRLLCIYGEDEADESGCLDGHFKTAEVIGIPGGHHFDENYEALAKRILTHLRDAS